MEINFRSRESNCRNHYHSALL